ncbi:MAG TPA: hypothetical protein EYP22_03830 [Methanosarcinales archaeon]|nr:hypothetical protein [Methanosarcinales archaeon]
MVNKKFKALVFGIGNNKWNSGKRFKFWKRLLKSPNKIQPSVFPSIAGISTGLGCKILKIGTMMGVFKRTRKGVKVFYELTKKGAKLLKEVFGIKSIVDLTDENAEVYLVNNKHLIGRAHEETGFRCKRCGYCNLAYYLELLIGLRSDAEVFRG